MPVTASVSTYGEYVSNVLMNKNEMKFIILQLFHTRIDWELFQTINN